MFFLVMVFLLLIRRGQMEKSSVTREFPVANAAYSLLKYNVSSSFGLPGWNKGRITCQRFQLKRFLSGKETSPEGIEKDDIFTLSNSPIPLLETKSSISEVKQAQQYGNVDTDRDIETRAQLMASAV